MGKKNYLKDRELMTALGYGDGINPFIDMYRSNVHRIRIMDQQQYMNSLTINGLEGTGIDNDMIMRIIYYRGQGILFFQKELNKFYFLPYTGISSEGNEGIDEYGRYYEATPNTFGGGATMKDKDRIWIPGLRKKIIYDVVTEDEDRDPYNQCVILRGYSPQYSQYNTPVQQIIDPLIQTEAKLLPMLMTAQMNNCGVSALRVDNEDAAPQVDLASQAVQLAALTGNKYIGIQYPMDMQEISGSNVAQATEFLQTWQAVDNCRLETHGLSTNGLFVKAQHQLQSEADMNGNMSDLVMQDRMYQAQKFCDIANSVFGLALWPSCNSDPAMANLGGVQENYENAPEEGGNE